MITASLLNNQIKRFSKSNTLLDMMIEFERVLDNIDIYAYKNWEHGEVLAGPHLERHYVRVKLLWPENLMPDPQGAKRLMARECLVKYTRETLVRPAQVNTSADIEYVIKDDGRQIMKPRKVSEPVWVVEIHMPRKYVDEFASDLLALHDEEYLDSESLNAENQISQEFDQGGS